MAMYNFNYSTEFILDEGIYYWQLLAFHISISPACFG